MKRQIPGRLFPLKCPKLGRGMAGRGKFVLLSAALLLTVLLLSKESPTPGGGGVGRRPPWCWGAPESASGQTGRQTDRAVLPSASSF